MSNSTSNSMQPSKKRKLPSLSSPPTKKHKPACSSSKPTSSQAKSKSKSKSKPSSNTKALRTANDLPWKPVAARNAAGLDMDMEEGFLDLEEVEGVEVVYEGGEGGKVVKFRVGGEGGDEEELDVDVEDLDVGSEGEDEEEDGDGQYDLPPDEEELAVMGPEMSDEEDEVEVVEVPEDGKVLEDVDEDVDVEVEGEVEEVEEVKLVETFDAATLLPAWHALFASPPSPSPPSAAPASSTEPTSPSQPENENENGKVPQTQSLHPTLLRTLHSQAFTTPTPIQAATLPRAMQGRDVIGVAETGSGKTLAYGLPILSRLLAAATSPSTSTASPRLIQTAQGGQGRKPQKKRTRRPLRALILAPTRELALQVSAHLNTCLNGVYNSAEGGGVKVEEQDGGVPEEGTGKGAKSGKGNGKTGGGKKGKGSSKNQKTTETKTKAPPLVSVAAIVGGMSAQKQKRVLERGVDVLVATPGRLWDVVEEDPTLAEDIKHLHFLVLDEADRMIETGHFKELDGLLRLTRREFQKETTETDFDFGLHTKGQPEPDSESGKQDGKEGEGEGVNDTMQTFVFSATLSKDLQRNLKKRSWYGGAAGGAGGKKGKEVASTLDELLQRLDFRDPEPEVVDLSPEGGVVETLKECKIECLMTEKDIYLYYFLLRYPGRTLVFLASVDGIRRMLPLFEFLGLPVWPLHSQMEQRQRLKNLDRFKSNPHAVLLATDIASRGLDIPSVDHVVHYQIPRTADAYVHRNGRTARASRKGFGMLMCAPDERRVMRGVLGSLGREESSIPEMTIEHHLLDKLKPRLQLARQIENAQHKAKKEKHEKNWLKEMAEAMDVDLDESLGGGDDDAPSNPMSQRLKAKTAKLNAMKAELKRLLAQPLVARGVSTKYITSGSRPIVDDIVRGEYHEGMVGVKKAEAGDDLMAAKKSKGKDKKMKKAKKGKGAGVKKEEDGDGDDGEEWTGFGS